MKNIKYFAFLLLLPVILTGCSLVSGGPSVEAEPVTLEFWGVFDSSDAYSDIIAAYQLARPNITVKYKKLRWQEYEDELIQAWAEDRGPDVFLIHNTWVGQYMTKIEPMPEKLVVPILIQEKGAFKNKVRTEVLKKDTLSFETIKKGFVEVVYEDVIREGQVWGLPLSVDSLALFYNQSILDAAGVIEPPRTWSEVTEAVKAITRQDSEGRITRSAIGMGGSDNIFRSFDILSLLMMQNGTQMTDSRGNITFDARSTSDSKYYPGIRALDFYTDFASPLKEVYTWNDKIPEATDAFLQGRLAMMFGYAYQLPYLRAQGPSLNFGVTSVPHINADGTDATVGQGVNLASYWLMTASKKSEHPNEVWDFILFAAADNYVNESGLKSYQVESYLNSTSKPPALRSLLSKYRQEPNMDPFVSQALTAKSWYKGNNVSSAEKAFDEMISNIVEGKAESKKAISTAVKAVNATY